MAAASDVDQRLLNHHCTHYDYGSVENEVSTTKQHGPEFSVPHTVFIISSLATITIASSISTGLLTVGLPRMADDLQLPDYLLLWPNSVYPLASGSCLLFAGTLADLTSSRVLNILGTFLLAIFILASGIAQDGYQLIAARTAQGVAVSLCFPTSVAIITASFPNGRIRNIGFSCLGLAQPLGFSIGLVVEGLIENTPLGWRTGFYVCSVTTIILAISNCWLLPKDDWKWEISLSELAQKIDWLGAVLSSVCLGLLSYILALLTESLDNIYKPRNIALLCISLAFMPAFVLWMHRQERLGKPALMPNSLWKNIPFLTICIIVLFQWAVVQSMELFLSLFFQKVQLLPSILASLRLLPNILIGIFLNITTGLFVHHFRADILIMVVSALAAGSPLLMAVINPLWNWWVCAFWAVLLGPVSVDIMFTMAHLIVVDVFPPSTHALAGAVFNTVAQFGTSLGLAAMAVISSSVQNRLDYVDKHSPEALMLGYRAVFWTCFVIMCVTSAIGGVGLRRVGQLGMSKE